MFDYVCTLYLCSSIYVLLVPPRILLNGFGPGESCRFSVNFQTYVGLLLLAMALKRVTSIFVFPMLGVVFDR